MRRLLTLLVVLGLAGIALGFWYYRASGQPTTTFKTATVERGHLKATISATGTIEPEEVVDVGAQVAGMIKNFGRADVGYLEGLEQTLPWVPGILKSFGLVNPDEKIITKTVDYGTVVKADMVLARIDEALYKAQVDQAKANVARAEADLKQMIAKLHQTERDWGRVKELGSNKGVVSGLDYDTTLAAYETARSSLAVGYATIDQMKAALNQAEINLGYCTIKSPVNGVIVDRRVNVGQTVVASLNAPSLFLIAKDLKRLQIWASVNEADIGQIAAGQPVNFTVDAFPNKVFTGTVEQIRLNATMTQNVVTYTVVVNTENKDGKLLPYMTANLQFEIDEHKNVLLVPNAALRWRPSLQQVAPDARGAFQALYHKDPSEKAGGSGDSEHPNRGVVWVEDAGFVRPVRVHTGLNDGAMTEITKGDLKEKDVIVVGGQRSGGDAGGGSPFTPQMFGGKKSN